MKKNISEVLHRQKKFYNQKYKQWEQTPSIEIFWEYTGDKIIKLLNIECNKTYLFLGSGDGYLLKYIAKKTQAKMVGIDISNVALTMCQSNRPTNTFFLYADAQRLPFKDNCFDGIIAYGILHHLSRLDLAFSEFNRVLGLDKVIFSTDTKDYILRWLFNPLLKNIVSEDEMQFKFSEIEEKYTNYGFEIMASKPLYLFLPIFVPLLRRIKYKVSTRLFKAILKIDSFFAKKKSFASLSWVVTMAARLKEKN